jgi:hypothetical protein
VKPTKIDLEVAAAYREHRRPYLASYHRQRQALDAGYRARRVAAMKAYRKRPSRFAVIPRGTQGHEA